MLRRQFIATAGGGLTALAAPAAKSFRFAVIGDTHIIDEFYKGPEGSPEDTDTIFKTSERLTATRDMLARLTPKVERTFICGDYFHNYPSTDLDFFFKNKTRIDNAKALTDSFPMPVHAGFGNHDYNVPKMPREASHELFRRKLGLEPYYAVDYKGFQFIHLNNFLGDTWQAGHEHYDKKTGSFGEQQLNWFEARLQRHVPAFVFLHFPLVLVKAREKADYGVIPLIKKHRESIQAVVAGHWHRWFEFGRSFGPPHYVVAATRYDPNAYLLFEADPARATHRTLNLDRVDWNTHYLLHG